VRARQKLIYLETNDGGLSAAVTLIRNASVSPAGAPRTRPRDERLSRALPDIHVRN